MIPSSLNAEFKLQHLTPIALQASGIITLFLLSGLLFSNVTNTIPLAAAVVVAIGHEIIKGLAI